MKILIVFAGQGIRGSDFLAPLKEHPSTRAWLKKFKLPDGLSANRQWMIGAYQLTLFHLIIPHLKHHHIELAGYSLGEVSAYLASMNITPNQASQVYRYRTQLMSQLHGQYDLMSIRGEWDEQTLQSSCQAHACFPAIILAEDHLLLGGKIRDLNALLKTLPKRARAQFLNIHCPSHTPIYQSLQGQLKAYLDEHTAKGILQYPILSPIALQKITLASEERHCLDQELYTPLQWQSLCQLMAEYGYDHIIDIGPGDGLRGTFPTTIPVLSVANFKHLQGFVHALDPLRS